ncbi:CHAD domain-containing protein [Kitasatospora acidiphila]|nr:CHAD domain-containing protein [Kitasatospora acidiphila]
MRPCAVGRWTQCTGWGVSARRLRSLLKAHRRLFDRRRADPMDAQLRWLGRLLGEVRDQEVLGDQLVDGLDAVPTLMLQGALRGLITERYAHSYRQSAPGTRLRAPSRRQRGELRSAWRNSAPG